MSEQSTDVHCPECYARGYEQGLRDGRREAQERPERQVRNSS